MKNEYKLGDVVYMQNLEGFLSLTNAGSVEMANGMTSLRKATKCEARKYRKQVRANGGRQ